MNNSTFLTDSTPDVIPYKMPAKGNFISSNEKNNISENKYDIAKYEKKTNKYVITSATSRKWSIKFKND